MSEALISKEISNWQLFTKKSYISDKRAPIQSSKCMFIMLAITLHVNAWLNSFLSRVYFSSLAMVQAHICPPLPLLHCSYHHGDHHIIHWCWKHHMWQTHHLHVLKNQCQHPSKCLAEFSLHGRHHPFLQYWNLSHHWCWIHAPLKKKFIIDCVTYC